MKHSMKISMMALVAMFVVSTTADAQFGKLLNKAKKAVKEKVEDTKSDAVSSAKQQAEQTASSQAGGVVGGYDLPDRNIAANSSMDYSIARANDWNADSNADDILADLAYHLKNSHKLESYLHVTRHYPAFNDVIEARLKVISGLAHAAGMSSFKDGVTDPKLKEKLEGWRREMIRLVSSPNSYYSCEETMGSWMIRNADGILTDWAQMLNDIEMKSTPREKLEAFNKAYIVLEKAFVNNRVNGTEGRLTGNFDKFKAAYSVLPADAQKWYAEDFSIEGIKQLAQSHKSESAAFIAKANTDRGAAEEKYRKDELLKMYKEAAAAGRYVAMPAAKGNSTETYIKNYVEKKYPEWGKVIRVSAPLNYNVHRDKLGNIKNRTHAVTIVCEDQGYKAVHGISMREDYKGGRYMNGLPDSDRWNSGPLKLVK